MDAVAEVASETLLGAAVEVVYSPAETRPEAPAELGPNTSSSVAEGPPGWRVELDMQLGAVDAALGGTEQTLLSEVLRLMPGAALRTAASHRSTAWNSPPDIGPAMRRALRDEVIAEVLSDLLTSRVHREVRPDLVAATLDFLIELSGTRVESHDLTHGVVITDVLRDEPRLRFAYPADVSPAKRAPLLFDGLRSVLIVDPEGRARTELQRHRIDRLGTVEDGSAPPSQEFVETGSLVGEVTRRLGGLGLFLGKDRTIRAFIDGEPLLVRRGEHWTAFPLELGSSIAAMIGEGPGARIVVPAALMIAGQRHGAILAIVSGPEALQGIVSLKDRYDLRNEFDVAAMRTETRLHHLIDATDLDELTLARLATLDGATILDREARLLAYGAVVASSGSEHEGARTAAAKTLSQSADVVLKVSADGDITIFRGGAAIRTLLGQRSQL